MKIISGGQTGVDRAALDFAIRYGYEHGGWCPRGRAAEDGPIDPRYALRETDSTQYDVRTRQNVLDSEATLIVVRDRPLTGGTALTHDLAVELNRPVLVVSEAEGVAESARKVSEFLKVHAVKILNVAGPRESEAPQLGRFVADVLKAVLTNC
jgi:hypothetical protein